MKIFSPLYIYIFFEVQIRHLKINLSLGPHFGYAKYKINKGMNNKGFGTHVELCP